MIIFLGILSPFKFRKGTAGIKGKFDDVKRVLYYRIISVFIKINYLSVTKGNGIAVFELLIKLTEVSNFYISSR